MSNFIDIKHINRNEVLYLVRNLNDFEKNKAVGGGLMAAGKVFESGGKSRLKRTMKSGSQGVTGNLLRSFHTRLKKSKPGVLIGFKQGEGGGSHSHLVDMGTAERYWKTKTGKSVGRVIPNRFWSDTEAQDYPTAMDRLYVGIEKAVNRIASRR